MLRNRTRNDNQTPIQQRIFNIPLLLPIFAIFLAFFYFHNSLQLKYVSNFRTSILPGDFSEVDLDAHEKAVVCALDRNHDRLENTNISPCMAGEGKIMSAKNYHSLFNLVITFK